MRETGPAKGSSVSKATDAHPTTWSMTSAEIALADRAAAGWLRAMEHIAEVTPKGWRTERGDATALVTRTAIPALNLAVSLNADPDLAALDSIATDVAACGVPWSIMIRHAASAAVADLAARHGLVVRADVPMMACRAQDAVLHADGERSRLIRPVSSVDAATYTDALTECFGVNDGDFGSLMDDDVLDTPGIVGYLAEASGVPVATGLGIRTGRTVGVFNIAVVPRLRSEGLGRAMTARVLADGLAGGADIAYLLPSTEGIPLYGSMGFRLLETWTQFHEAP